MTVKSSISLTDDQHSFAKTLVDSGRFPSVSAVLQSGFLRFFKTFHYDRLGLSCQLRNDVCLMGGLEPTATGYYIVKGGGLPRIDIIGNAGRVDWPTLLAQIQSGMQSHLTVR